MAGVKNNAKLSGVAAASAAKGGKPWHHVSAWHGGRITAWHHGSVAAVSADGSVTA